jgi:hypothetical protein
MQQQTNPPQSSVPAPPPAPARTRAQLDALVARRAELGNQLQSATERRGELASQLRQSDLTARSDLQSRLKVLDDRSARLESEILQADDAIASALARGITLTKPPDPWTLLTQPRRPEVGQVVATTMFVEAVGFVLLGIVLWRYYLRRARAKFARPVVDPSNRLDQLQNAVDAIAVEVERISEGQRYVTKLMDEKLRVAIGAGEAQPIPAKHQSHAPVRASGESA